MHNRSIRVGACSSLHERPAKRNREPTSTGVLQLPLDFYQLLNAQGYNTNELRQTGTTRDIKYRVEIVVGH